MLSDVMERSSEAGAGRLGDLYRAHADGAVRLAYLLTGDRALAEDLVQDAFVRLAGRLVHLRDQQAFDAYLRRTVVNLSNSYFRRRKVEWAFMQSARGALDPQSVQRAPSVDDREDLWRALGRLSARQRAAVVLRYYEDLSERDVAQILRCQPGTVKSLVARGLEKLRSDSDIRGEGR